MKGETRALWRRWTPLALLAAVMVLGGALRFYGLGIQSLWSDELASWYFSREGLWEVPLNVREDIHPPGYFIVLHLFQAVFGDAEWALRLPSALAGWLSIPAIFLLGRRIYSEKEGLISALLVAVSWTPIYFSQETRSYSILILLSIVTAFFWFNVMENLRQLQRLPAGEAAAYVLSAVACSYAHYFGALLVALQGAALAALAYRSFPRVVLLYVPVALAYVPWLPGMAYQVRNSTQYGAWIGEPTLADFPRYVVFLFGRSEPLALFACALFALLLIRAFASLQNQEGPASPTTLLLVAWFFGPFVAGYLLSQGTVGLLTHKNLLVSLPAAYLLISRGITGVWPHRTVGTVLQGSLALVLAAACLFNLFSTQDYYSSPSKEQIRAAAAFVNERETGQTLVVRCDIDNRLDYYLNDGDPRGRPDVDACTEKDFPELAQRVRDDGYREVFYLMSHKRPTPGLVARLRTEFELVRYRPFYRTWVAVFRVDGRSQDTSKPPTVERG